jgi:phospholipid/cholesterol/gamma-HCH transport system permease protein
MNDAQNATINQVNHTLTCRGNWTLNHLNDVITETGWRTGAMEITIAGDAITAMDSAGAWVLWKLLQTFKQQGKKFKLSGFKQEHESLMALIDSESEKLSQVIPPQIQLKTLAQIGYATVHKGYQVRDFITFLGEIAVHMWKNIRRPRLFQWRSFLNIIDETGFSALPIVGLLSFSIGVVLAYQGAQQLRNYGADTYIVSLLGIAILQEFGPLITAIIVAGRTSSAFTAQIGTMQINEEIDALRTMGLSPVNRLVLPKVIGLIVAMPLLVLWADIFGLLGGMITTKQTLNIGIYNFILQFPQVIELNTFINGMIKTPVFAVIIAAVGCFQGFRVGGTADSIGKQTTKSVVQAIFLIIIADSIFSIILPWQNI